MKPGIEAGKALWRPQLGASQLGAVLEVATYYRLEYNYFL